MRRNKKETSQEVIDELKNLVLAHISKANGDMALLNVEKNKFHEGQETISSIEQKIDVIKGVEGKYFSWVEDANVLQHRLLYYMCTCIIDKDNERDYPIKCKDCNIVGFSVLVNRLYCLIAKVKENYWTQIQSFFSSIMYVCVALDAEGEKGVFMKSFKTKLHSTIFDNYSAIENPDTDKVDFSDDKIDYKEKYQKLLKNSLY